MASKKPPKRKHTVRDGVTQIHGKGTTDEEKVQAFTSAALDAIQDAYELHTKLDRQLKAAKDLAKTEIEAAEAEFEAAIEEPTKQSASAKQKADKLQRCEQSWGELKEKEAEHSALVKEAKNATDGAWQKLVDAIAASKQGALDFGDAEDEEQSAEE